MKTNNLYAQLSVGQGPAGPVGPQGPKGDKGDKGETGAVGPQGPKGDKGERGARGERGLTGPTGLQGERGAQGPEGQRGPQGIQGPKGDKGDKGPKGDKGDTGAQGPKGDRGEKGEKGDSGGVMPADMVDYVGNQHKSLKAKNDADVEWLLGKINGAQEEINTVHYEGQHITATNTIEGRAKSAILKGQTMVNLLDAEILKGNKGKINVLFNVILEDDYFVSNHGNGQFQIVNDDGKSPFEGVFEEGKTYTLIIDATTTDKTGDGDDVFLELNTTTHTTPNLKFNNANGIIKRAFKATKRATPETKSIFKIGFYDSAITKINRKIMLLEGDYTNVDIPFFEGMTSVKAPVLKTTGKNLFDMNHASYITGLIHVSNQTINQTAITKAYYIPCEPNTSYTISKMMTQYFRICETSVVPTFGCSISNTVNNPSRASLTITTSESAKYLCFNVHNKSADTMDESEVLATVQIEKGSAATSYEPYKSNILTTPEEVVLRSVENTQDTINLNTGEYVQRIGEVILNGSEPWHVLDNNTENTIGFTLQKVLPLKKTGDKYVKVNCDKLPSYKENLWNNDKIGCVAENNINQDLNNTQLQVRVLKSALSTQDSNGFKSWLQTNPLTIQYISETPVIETVDLSDNNVYSYKDTTYYDCSSAEGSLVPTLSLDVPTKLNALVARQKDTIQELTQENESLKAAQQILLNSQLSFYESLVSTIPALMPAEGQAIIPDFIQDLYRLKNNQK